MRPIRFALPAVALMALALVSNPVPVAAQATLASDLDAASTTQPAPPSSAARAAVQPGGAWVALTRNGRRGIVLLDWADRAGSSARLSVHLTGLHPGDRVRLVLRSATCSQPVTKASRLFAAWMNVGAKGQLWRDRAGLDLDRGTLEEVRTVRLMEEEGIFYFCRAASVWDDTDIVHRNGAWAVLGGGSHRGIAVVGPADGSGSRIAWSLSIGSDTNLRLVGTSTSCAAPASPHARLLSLPVVPVGPGVSFFQGRTETVDKDETIATRALRLKVTGGASWACERPGIIAILIG